MYKISTFYDPRCKDNYDFINKFIIKNSDEIPIGTIMFPTDNCIRLCSEKEPYCPVVFNNPTDAISYIELCANSSDNYRIIDISIDPFKSKDVIINTKYGALTIKNIGLSDLSYFDKGWIVVEMKE